jgi:hypothetical protein
LTQIFDNASPSDRRSGNSGKDGEEATTFPRRWECAHWYGDGIINCWRDMGNRIVAPA